MQDDRKLAITIAASLGAAVVLIAGLSFLGRPGNPEGAPVPGTAPLVEPASVTGPAVPVSAGTPEEAEAFQVEPGVDALARGIESYQNRNFDHAVAYLRAEVEANPDRPYSHYLLGLSLWKAGRLDEAPGAMNRSADLDGTAIKTFINLSRIQNDRGAYDPALEAARRALALDPDDPQALFLEGRSLHNLGEREAAAASLRRSLEIDPGNGYVWNLLGLTLLQQGDDAGALAALEAAAGIVGEVAYVQNNLGMALERSGRPREAVAAYRRAVELGGHERASVNLARLEPTLPPAEETAVAGVPGASAAGEQTADGGMR
jgi:Flp pilus assembly protein TadD